MKQLKLAVFAIAATLISISAEASYTKTKYPIVLVHGVAGFDQVGGLIDYFHTVPYNLRRSGAKVYTPSLSAFSSSEVRGQQLANYLSALNEKKFNLIGHSQGSPTSRVTASLIPQKIASVTSVNGVNGGSVVADIVLGLIPSDLSKRVVSGVVNGLGGLINILSGSDNPQDSLASAITLSTQGTMNLNQALDNKGLSSNCSSISEDVNINGYNVKMYSWSGNRAVTNVFDATDGFLAITSLAFGQEKSDGLVSECSSKLGRVISTKYSMNHVDAQNHLFGVRGWTNPVSLYRTHANRLKNSGL